MNGCNRHPASLLSLEVRMFLNSCCVQVYSGIFEVTEEFDVIKDVENTSEGYWALSVRACTASPTYLNSVSLRKKWLRDVFRGCMHTVSEHMRDVKLTGADGLEFAHQPTSREREPKIFKNPFHADMPRIVSERVSLQGQQPFFDGHVFSSCKVFFVA